MKKMRGVFLFLIAVLVFLPMTVNAETIASPKPYDYKKGLLDDSYIIKYNDLLINSYDNNLDTYQRVSGQTYSIVFTQPVDIDAMFLSAKSAYNTFVFKLVGGTEKSFSVRNGDDYNEVIDFGLSQVKSIEMSGNSNGHTILREVDFFGSYEKNQKVYDPISKLKEKHTHEEVVLSWELPNMVGLSKVLIKENGVVIADLSATTTNYKMNKLTPEKKYTFDVIAKYGDGGTAEPVTITVITDSLPVEIDRLRAKPTHERVDLTWKLPESDNFKNAVIYRDQLKKSIFDKFMGVASASTNPIFETNGTYFNDLTVKPETKYQYTVTTMSKDQIESDGVSVVVTTLEAPLPGIGGGGYDRDPVTGDYTYYWTDPKVGNIKVMVGGKLYATVPAANGKIVIPADKMKYTIFGNPDVQLIPVDEEGNEGKPVKPPNGGGSSGGDGSVFDKVPIDVSDVIKAAMGIIGLISGIILIALAIELAPRVIRIIKKSMEKERKGAS